MIGNNYSGGLSSNGSNNSNGNYEHWTYGSVDYGNGSQTWSRNDITGDLYNERGEWIGNINDWK